VGILALLQSPALAGSFRKRLAVVSIVVFAVIFGIACGKYRQHVYRDRMIGRFGAYFKDWKQVHTADMLDLNENGSCVHSYVKSGEKYRTEQSCTWTLVDKFDGSWLVFEELSDGVHRHCTGRCVAEGAAWDGENATGFDLPSVPDVVYVK
jgi:hypothetical protein